MNSKGHLFISIAKSVIRITSCVALLVTKKPIFLGAGLLVAEILGIAEELVDKR